MREHLVTPTISRSGQHLSGFNWIIGPPRVYILRLLTISKGTKRHTCKVTMEPVLEIHQPYRTSELAMSMKSGCTWEEPDITLRPDSTIRIVFRHALQRHQRTYSIPE